MPAAGPSDPSIETLLAITQLPTAAGREGRVIDTITRWVARRPDLVLAADPAGNLSVTFAPGAGGAAPGPPIYITAHLDHPAFVVERILGPAAAMLSFRGGVNDDYFKDARIVIHAQDGAPLAGTLTGKTDGPRPMFKYFLADLDTDDGAPIRPGDVATWLLPPPQINAANVLHTNACDDLAAVAAALVAMDRLRALRRSPPSSSAFPLAHDVRLLFTRAEEVGFLGAIAACKHATIPPGSIVFALENSRSFADSPIGGGPIVRVGDRLSIFTPWLTNACAKRAEQITGRPAQPTASQTNVSAAPPGAGRWQRKLMPGGACEASVFCAFGYDATCLCLPLGNYHNMADLAAVQDGTYDAARRGPPRVAREFISVDDYLGLIDLLVAVATDLPRQDPVKARVEALYEERGFVLEE